MSYHSIYIPFTDIYILGGPEVFFELQAKKEGQKNLLVFPSPFGKQIDPNASKNKFSSGMEGGKDVLEFLKTLKQSKISDSEVKRSMRKEFLKEGNPTRGLTLYEANEGLDIAYVDYADFREEEFKVSALEEKIRERWQGEKGRPILITSTARYHLKYHSRDMEVQDPDFLLVNADIVNEGVLTGNAELFEELKKLEGKRKEGTGDGILPLESAVDLLGRELFMHQFIKMMTPSGYRYAKVRGKYKRNKSGSRIIKVENPGLRLIDEQAHKDYYMQINNMGMSNVLGVTPWDMEQFLAFQYILLNQDVSLGFVTGSQGSGKTLLAYAAAVDQILTYESQFRQDRGLPKGKKGGFYKKIILLKSNDIIGGKARETGFLPGTLWDKMKPVLQPYIDAHRETILGEDIPFEDMIRHPKFANDYGEARSQHANKKIGGFAYLPKQGEIVEVVSSGLLRGRSFRNTLMLIDEAQNFTPYEIKTILERLGDGCKAIVMGDPAQHDNPKCSREINGLTHAIQHYLHRPYSALVALTQNYRHQISDDARSWKVYSQ